MTDFDKAIEDARADVLPFESWERLAGETSFAFAAFCAFRDFGPERSIRKAVEGAQLRCDEKDKTKQGGKYTVWRNWCTQYRWRERAADYDRHIEHLKQGEIRKTIEAQGAMHRDVTRKMLEVVQKKLDTMNPADLAPSTVTEWVGTAIRSDREAAGLVASNGKPEAKQGELNFSPDFQGL